MVSLREFVARWSKVFVPGGIILGVVGGLIFNWYPVLGGLLAAVGGVTALYSWWASEAKVMEHENFMEAQTILLAKGGLGNAITESVQNELRKGGLAKDVAARLRRALELTPDDVETLELLSASLALVLNYKNFVLQTTEWPGLREAIAEARSYAERGHGIAPQSFVLLGSLGILCDLEGDHEQARDYFRRAGDAGAGPAWRLYAGASYGMEGKFPQGLAEIEKAADEGVEGWLVDLYRGRALNNVGRFDEAFGYLCRSYGVRGRVPELLVQLALAAMNSGRTLTAAKYDWLMELTLARRHGKERLGAFFLSTYRLILTALLALSKKVWPYTRRAPILNRLQVRFLPPDSPEALFVLHLASEGKHDAALLLARRALRLMPERFRNHESVVVLLVNTQNHNEALEVCGRALERWPNHPLLSELYRIVDEQGHAVRFVPLQDGSWRAEKLEIEAS